MPAFGLDEETVRTLNPRALFVRMPAFGLDGPWRDRAGFAMTVEQVSGLAWVTGYEDMPLVVRGACDPLGSAHAVFAIGLALEERNRTGLGQVVEIALVEPALAVAWKEFAGHFTAVPRDATATLASALPELMAGNRADAGAIQKLTTRIERLQAIYADSNKELLADLREPPAYLWPMASIVAERSGYRQAVTLNRALYLAQTGEIGTARVMLAGLNASVEDPDVLATIYYMLGRLQFELFRATPEVEYYMQSIQYLRQSLVADPGLQLAQRLLDFLLSLPQAETAPQSPDGRPETPSEGEGAAVSAEKRIF